MITLHKGKRIDNNEWVLGYLWQGSNCTVIIPHNLGVDFDKNDHRLKATAYEVDPTTVGIGINMLDKNLTPLYEYDIVKRQDSEEDKAYIIAHKDGIVGLLWGENGQARFEPFTDTFVKSTDFEKVSNIFE